MLSVHFRLSDALKFNDQLLVSLDWFNKVYVVFNCKLYKALFCFMVGFAPTPDLNISTQTRLYRAK